MIIISFINLRIRSRKLSFYSFCLIAGLSVTFVNYPLKHNCNMHAYSMYGRHVVDNWLFLYRIRKIREPWQYPMVSRKTNYKAKDFAHV